MTPQIPPSCNACIQNLQATCLHQHTTVNGGWHFIEGEAWDDITETCDDCGTEVTFSLPWFIDLQDYPY